MPSKIAEEFTTRYVIEEHIKGVVIRKSSNEPRNERVAGDIAQNSALVSDVIDLLKLDDLGLP